MKAARLAIAVMALVMSAPLAIAHTPKLYAGKNNSPDISAMSASALGLSAQQRCKYDYDHHGGSWSRNGWLIQRNFQWVRRC